MAIKRASSYERRFSAVRGVQAGREYYLVNCPFYLLPELFNDMENSEVPPAQRAQRLINKARAGAIRNYLIVNKQSYVFSAATVSIDGDVSFNPVDQGGSVGVLTVKDRARYVINDGQHRISAIVDALREADGIEYEHLPLIFFNDPGLRMSQQIFTDLNRYTLKPAQSLSILYDSRDPYAEVARVISEKVSYFNGATEYEKATISNRSVNMFTLNGLYNATKMLLPKGLDDLDEQIEFARRFWEHVGDSLQEWQMCRDGKITASALRHDYLSGHNFFLQVAAGAIGSAIAEGHEMDCAIKTVCALDWKRSNALWQKRALHNGKITKSNISLTLATNVVKRSLGLPLTEKEQTAEDSFLHSR